MDIVDFAEKFMDVELADWQKDHIRLLYEKYQDCDIRIVMPKNAGRHQAFVYIAQIKELILNEPTTHCE